MSECLSAICKSPFCDSRHPAPHITLAVLSIAFIIIGALANAGVMDSCMGPSNAAILGIAGIVGVIFAAAIEIYLLYCASKTTSMDPKLASDEALLTAKLTEAERDELKNRLGKIDFSKENMLNLSPDAICIQLRFRTPQEYITYLSKFTQGSPGHRLAPILKTCILEMKREAAD